MDLLRFATAGSVDDGKSTLIGRLLFDTPLESPLTLAPLYPDGVMVDGRTVRFVRDGSGKVTGFRVFAGRVRNVRFDREEGR